MNPENNEPLYGNAEVIDRHGKSAGAPATTDQQKAKVTQADITAIMGYGARMAWWRRNRPSLDQMADNPAGLSASQTKAMHKQVRKRAANIARLAKKEG